MTVPIENIRTGTLPAAFIPWLGNDVVGSCCDRFRRLLLGNSVLLLLAVSIGPRYYARRLNELA